METPEQKVRRLQAMLDKAGLRNVIRIKSVGEGDVEQPD